ncbi:MAG TPA: preprotein translocase subunit SecE [Acidobacteriaceae bacterium]|jgi:preprotein translocase subunit SecE|nr:preprotein translocase subunit SecE [Acidobacteriaceae bacterium]
MAKTAIAPASAETPEWKAAPQRLISFLKDTRSEMRKVVWPGREQVRSNTLIVLICVFFFAAFFFAVDKVIGTAIETLLQKLIAH